MQLGLALRLTYLPAVAATEGSVVVLKNMGPKKLVRHLMSAFDVGAPYLTRENVSAPPSGFLLVRT